MAIGSENIFDVALALPPDRRAALASALLESLEPSDPEQDKLLVEECKRRMAAYEAGELDMVQTPSEDVTRVKADPNLQSQVVDIPQLSITYYTYNNGIDPKTLKPFAKCADLSC